MLCSLLLLFDYSGFQHLSHHAFSLPPQSLAPMPGYRFFTREGIHVSRGTHNNAPYSIIGTSVSAAASDPAFNSTSS